jgi:imidazolonepropionase-like amidohydrolase
LMNIQRRSVLGALSAGLLAPTLGRGQSRPPLLIRNARIVPVSGPVLAKGSVLVEDGLIAAIGETVAAPVGAQVLEAEGLTVYPGLIDCLTNVGMQAGGSSAGTQRGPLPAPSTSPVTIARGPEDRPLTTPWVKAADMVRTSDPRIPAARGAGFASAVVFPASGIFAGQGAVINLAGEKAGQMVVEPSVGMYTTLATNRGGGFPGSLMGVIAYIRQIYMDAEHYQTAMKIYKENPSLPRPQYDRALEGILEAPVTLFPASGAREIDRMIRLAKELKTKPVFYGLQEGFRRVEELKASGAGLLVNLRWPEAPRDQDPEDQEDLRALELRDQAPSTPGLLAKAGAKFGFSSAGIERPADIFRAVKKAIDAGLPQAEAVRAMTLSAAEMFGVSKRLGSIERGKIANLTVTKGELFADSTRVQYVLIDGLKYDPLPEEGPAARPEATR